MVLMRLSFILCLVAFLFGAFKLFKKDVPVYYKICVCAIGCYTLGLLSYVVFGLCGSESFDTINIGLLGLFGCLCFLVSANLGGDNINERKEIRFKLNKKDSLAYVAPAVLVLFLIGIMLPMFKTKNTFELIFLIVMFAPVLPASFLSLLYLIKPGDKLQLFKFTKLCNLCILLFCISNSAYLYFCFCMQ